MKTAMKLLLVSLSFAVTSTFASGGAEVHLDSAPINLKDTASLQRGARTFINYCLNCHNAQFMRYSHLTQIGLTEQQIKENLMFTTDKIGDTMVSALDPADAKDWLKSVPPDLTLAARVRGSDWLYTYMRSFYHDDASPTGWNNTVFKGVSMPHVLHDLQGTQAMVQVGEKHDHDGKIEPLMKLAIDRAGSMSPGEYDRTVADLVNYMTFMAEPVRGQRTQLGVLVLFFLVIAFFVTLALKHEYWKDVK